MNLKKIGKVFTSKFVRTGPLSYERRIYRDVVSRRLRNSVLELHIGTHVHMYLHVKLSAHG